MSNSPTRFYLFCNKRCKRMINFRKYWFSAMTSQKHKYGKLFESLEKRNVATKLDTDQMTAEGGAGLVSARDFVYGCKSEVCPTNQPTNHIFSTNQPTIYFLVLRTRLCLNLTAQVRDGLHIMAGCSVNLADQPEVKQMLAKSIFGP